MALALITFLAAFIMTSGLCILLFGPKKTTRRLSQVLAPTSDLNILRTPAAPPSARLEKLVRPLHSLIPSSPEDIITVRRRLARAGYRDASWANIFRSLRLLVPATLCILVTVTGVYEHAPLFFYGLSAGLGFLVPDYWLANRINVRQRKLREGLPEALDLIVICVEAGLTMDKATMRTAEELRYSQPAIADELHLVYLEQRAGLPRSEAWRHLADRTDVDTIRSLASILIHADKFGTSIGKTLRTHAETLRTKRRQEVEEQAAKTTVKLVFPLVLLIFPSLFVVTMGPSLILMFEGFAEYLS